MALLDLPIELLAALPPFLHNIEDFTNAASSCRALRLGFSLVEPPTILQLASRSAPTFFSPHPWFLVLATARQVSDWALGDKTRTQELREAFQGGMQGLLDLCFRVCGITMDDIRRLHLARFSLINPLANKLDQIAGNDWYAAEDFWNGGVSDAWTVDCHPQRAAFQIMIYWELFGSTLRAFFTPELNLPKFDLQTRLDFIKYCIPDWICDGGYPGFEVLPVGPYHPDAKEKEKLPVDQVALHHILSGGRWERLWKAARAEVGPDFEGDWRQEMWKCAFLSFGLESMEIVKDVKITSNVDKRFLVSNTIQPDPILTVAWHQRLSEIRGQIARLDAVTQKPLTTVIGIGRQNRVSQAPNMGAETYLCMARFF
ncbi:hypothetical protein GQ53DRAFT_740653 [Thozetella sp. PMI_491]|nr:hypothetical protein GQ53DRAFT_740653 [Thozetella sp. PMI_491]